MARTYILRTTGVYVSMCSPNYTDTWTSTRVTTNDYAAQIGRYINSATGIAYYLYIQYMFDPNELAKLQTKTITGISFKIKQMNTNNNTNIKLAYAYYDSSLSENNSFCGNQAGTASSTQKIDSLVNISRSIEYEFATYTLPTNALPGQGFMIGADTSNQANNSFDSITTEQGQYTEGVLYVTTDEDPIVTLNTYTVPLTLSGFSSRSTDLVKQGSLKGYTNVYGDTRVGATANYKTGYAVRGQWPTNNSTVTYLKNLNSGEIKSITLHAVFQGPAGHAISTRCGELLESNYAKITPKTNTYVLIDQSATEVYADITTVGIADLGYGFGGTISSASNVGISSIEIIVETCANLYLDNCIYVVNDNSTLDKYYVYVVENNALVPYKVGIVNSTGTELQFCS